MNKSPILVALGNNIRHFRLLRGWSQETLADETGLHRTYIGDIERGERNIGVLNLTRIAVSLSVEPSDLVANITELKEESN